jgi:hypothetical protein
MLFSGFFIFYVLVRLAAIFDDLSDFDDIKSEISSSLIVKISYFAFGVLTDLKS